MLLFPNTALNFDEAYAIGEQLWAFGRVLQEESKYAKPSRWVLTYRYSIRAMMARIVSIDRDYKGLNTLGCGTAPAKKMTTQKARNDWNVVWESYAGVLFFAMDSSLECFAYALNALGYLLSPGEFIDITSDEKIKQITPANLLDPPTKDSRNRSVYGACLKYFPRICAHWSANRGLLAQIIEYHDVTKHRHSVVVGECGDYPLHLLQPAPKQAMEKIAFNDSTGLVAHNEKQSLQSITTEYHAFIIGLLRITRQELEVVFGQQLPSPH